MGGELTNMPIKQLSIVAPTKRRVHGTLQKNVQVRMLRLGVGGRGITHLHSRSWAVWTMQLCRDPRGWRGWVMATGRGGGGWMELSTESLQISTLMCGTF